MLNLSTGLHLWLLLFSFAPQTWMSLFEGKARKGLVLLEETLKQVKTYWQQQRLATGEIFPKNDLIKIFAENRLLVSQDVIEVFSIIGGFDENEMDDECLTFWTLEKILKENEPNSEFVYFADFLIDSHHYAFKFKDGINSSIYIHYSEKDRPKVASSFAEFFELYLTDTSRLFL